MNFSFIKCIAIRYTLVKVYLPTFVWSLSVTTSFHQHPQTIYTHNQRIYTENKKKTIKSLRWCYVAAVTNWVLILFSGQHYNFVWPEFCCCCCWLVRFMCILDWLPEFHHYDNETVFTGNFFAFDDVFQMTNKRFKNNENSNVIL